MTKQEARKRGWELKRSERNVRFRVCVLGDSEDAYCLLLWEVGKPWGYFEYDGPGLIYRYEEEY